MDFTKVQGGKAPNSQKSAKGGFLFSHKALAKVFAAKFKDALVQAGLTLPANLPDLWVVDCKSVGDGQAALRYLGRYLYRGVIAEQEPLLLLPRHGALPEPPPTRALWLCACGQPMVILRRRMPAPSSPCSAPQTLRPDKPSPMEVITH